MKLKDILCAGILILAVLICGCTTTPQESNAALIETPDLLGNWTGTMTGYEYGTGYTDCAGALMTLSVTEQQDLIFSGEISFTNQSGYAIWETTACAGVIGRDNTLTLVEGGGGHSSGSLIAPDEIEFIYLNGAEPFNIVINSLKRS